MVIIRTHPPGGRSQNLNIAGKNAPLNDNLLPMRSFYIFLLLLLPGVLPAQSEPIDPFSTEIDIAIRKLRQTDWKKMTAKVSKHIPNEDHAPVIQKVKYRLINDSVYVRCFKDRLIASRSYYVIRGNQTLSYNKRRAQANTNETVMRKDSAGYTVEFCRKDNGAVFYSRSYTDTLRHCIVLWGWNSLQPGMEQESEIYDDTLTITKEYRSSDGYRRLVRQLEFRHQSRPRGAMDTYITTTFDGDLPLVTQFKVITHLQRDNSGRLVHASKTEYRNGSEQYSDIRMMSIYYKE